MPTPTGTAEGDRILQGVVNQQQDLQPLARKKKKEKTHQKQQHTKTLQKQGISQPPVKDAVFSGSSTASQNNPPEERNMGVEGVSSIFEGVNATSP